MSADELIPGFAYQRSQSVRTETALEKNSLELPLDDALSQMEALLPRIVQIALQRSPVISFVSFGPACWLAVGGFPYSKTMAILYEPQIECALEGKSWRAHCLRSYAHVVSDEGHGIDGLLVLAINLIPDEILPIDTAGDGWMGRSKPSH